MLRSQALALYRRCLRAARWPDDAALTRDTRAWVRGEFETNRRVEATVRAAGASAASRRAGAVTDARRKRSPTPPRSLPAEPDRELDSARPGRSTRRRDVAAVRSRRQAMRPPTQLLLDFKRLERAVEGTAERTTTGEDHQQKGPLAERTTSRRDLEGTTAEGTTVDGTTPLGPASPLLSPARSPNRPDGTLSSLCWLDL